MLSSHLQWSDATAIHACVLTITVHTACLVAPVLCCVVTATATMIGTRARLTTIAAVLAVLCVAQQVKLIVIAVKEPRLLTLCIIKDTNMQ